MMLLVQLPSNATIELSIVSSPYHIELNPSDAGFHDRLIVQVGHPLLRASKHLHVQSTLPPSHQNRK